MKCSLQPNIQTPEAWKQGPAWHAPLSRPWSERWEKPRSRRFWDPNTLPKLTVESGLAGSCLAKATFGV